MNELDKMYRSKKKPDQFARSYLGYLSSIFEKLDEGAIGQFAHVVMDARDTGAQVIFLGNGGSAATADHFANDLCIGPRSWDKPIRAISLSSNSAILTCLGNDFGYENIFVKQLETVMQPGDVVVAISVSGNSPNVIEAVKYAKKNGAITIGLTGFDGGQLGELADTQICAITNPGEYGPAEDVHMVLCHLVTAYVTGRIQDEHAVSENTAECHNVPVLETVTNS